MAGLDGSKVLVIGGTSGIGLGVARAALAEGARVTVASSNQDRVESAVARLGGGTGVRLDVTSESAVAEFFSGSGQWDHVAFTAADWAQVDHTSYAEIDLSGHAHLFAVRFWGAASVAKHAAPRMTPGATLIFTNGMAAHRPQKGLALSTAMAGAVEHLVKGLAVELAPVRVNGVCPGAIRTEAWDELPADFRKFQEDRLSGQLVPRVGETAECAEAYLYLMKATYTTGQTLRVEGGWSLSG
ncbi:MAG: SDR family oxidoreductase [Novosphingobium sp.]